MSIICTIAEWANESIGIDLDELGTVYLPAPFLFPVIVDEWHVLLKRYRLMESSHGELGSNSHVILDQKQVIRSIKAQPEAKNDGFSISSFSSCHVRSIRCASFFSSHRPFGKTSPSLTWRSIAKQVHKRMYVKSAAAHVIESISSLAMLPVRWDNG